MYGKNNRNVTAKGGQRQTVEKLNLKENCHCEGRSPVAIRSPKPYGFGRSANKMATFWSTDCHVGLRPPRNDSLFRHADVTAKGGQSFQNFANFPSTFRAVR